MDLWKIEVGRRTYRLTAVGFFLGLIMFFNSSTVTGLLTGAFILAVSIGVLTAVTENLNSWPKIVTAWFILIAIPLLWIFMTTSSFCSMIVEPEYGIAENPVTGEVEQRYNPSSCDRVSFPWYYQSLNSSETEKYCQENPSKKYCEWKDTELGKRMSSR